MMNDRQIAMARRALVLVPGRIYRNHYCIGPEDPDYSQWMDLVYRGLATIRVNDGNWSGDFFHLTKKGIEEVMRETPTTGGLGEPRAADDLYDAYPEFNRER